MSFDLHSERGERFKFSSAGWEYYLSLAGEYGWQAAGTLPPDGIPDSDSWPKTYDSSDGQCVSEVDAEALAAALQAALDDPRRVERLTIAAKAESEALSQATGRPCQVRVETDDAVYIGQMIEFFRKGRFKIW
ncbi:MAG: hypothetical protein JWM16_6121 [Verrucomicrobiales bacterium]|nr:hypothetical protein [Verrucomicrobiales bacterium]